ncbi:hypothetical protein I4U23_026637 [Adineta vaga]|nr:hypothetical protein I4U23_026637 [Adineta vaga]
MAVNGFFTYEDLYASRSRNYNYKLILPISPSPSNIPNRFLSEADLSTKLTTDIPPSHPAKLIALTNELELSTKLNKLADIIPFSYFYWLLVILAIFLTLTLITIFICYCRTFVKNYKNRRGSLTSFYRYRTVNRRIYTQNKHPSIAPQPPPLLSLPTPPCPSQSLKCLNTQLQRQDLDLGFSPPTARHDLYVTEPLSTFTNSTSNLSSALQSRLSVRSSDPPPLKVEQSYESQRASMALDDVDQ